MMAAPLETIRALLPKLSQADQLALICDLIQGGHQSLLRSDAFIDAMIPVDEALCEAWDVLEAAADLRDAA